ncbi:MAG: MATE family efflux transporter [Denitrovibrio sp.]|nr:MAG: MATE family efflux transporter [Denitrovibrio sp.]
MKDNYSGSIKEMLSIALPMVVSNACETVMTFTDRLFLSKLGMEEMSAAMVGGISAFFMMTFFIGLMGYGTAMIAQYLGKGNMNKCSVVLTQTFIIAFVAYPILLAFKPVMHMMFIKTGISEAQLAHQFVYFDLLLYASIIALGRIALSNFFSGIGKTRVVMLASFLAMFINVIASYILIFGKFGFTPMGVKGAALGSITGSVFSLLILLGAYFRKSIIKDFSIMDSFRFDFDIIKRLFRFGTPSGIEFFMALFSFTLLISAFHAHNPVTAAGSTIMFNWDHVSFVPLMGLEIGVTSLVGRYVGAGRFDLVEKTVWSGLRLGWAVSFFVLVAFFFFPGVLADVFKPEAAGTIFEQARPLAVFMIRLASIYVLLQSVMLVYMGALKGSGDTLWSMIINVSFLWFVYFVLYVLLNVMHVSAETAWVAIVIIFTTLPIILYFRFRSGKWKTLNVVG